MQSSATGNLFDDVCSVDFLSFQFGGRSYQDQLYDSIAKTKVLSGVLVCEKNIPLETGKFAKVVWVTHDFGFLGGNE